jgi:hypothetical protein
MMSFKGFPAAGRTLATTESGAAAAFCTGDSTRHNGAAHPARSMPDSLPFDG